MRCLFIWPAPGALGGVETLLARMSHWLTEHDHQVDILVENGENWLQLLPRKARCIVLGKQFRELYYFFHAKRLWNSLAFPKPDVIKSFDLPSAWIASQLASIVGDRCKVISGLYGSFLFKWYYAQNSLASWSAARLYAQNYLRSIPESARLVCGIDQVEDLAETQQQRCILWPIPINEKLFNSARRHPRRGRIVSVGRLDVMKQYNLYMVDVVKELRAKDYDVTWSVYGTGENEQAMRKSIAGAGLEKVVTLEGTVPYHRFWEVLEDAYVFIGMGTAILEASLFGVPNVYALAYDRLGLTYGPVYRIPQGSIGPSLASPPTLRVIDEIRRILELSPEEYQAEEAMVRQHVLPHQIDRSMEQFLHIVSEADPVRQNVCQYLANYVRWIASRALQPVCRQKSRGHPTSLLFGTAKASF